MLPETLARGVQSAGFRSRPTDRDWSATRPQRGQSAGPPCGSGHFLLGCYDLLERAWALRGLDPAGAAPRIVASLWGVDIDARYAQIASVAIVLRARRHCRTRSLPRPNIVTARPLPTEMPDELDPDLRRLVNVIADALAQAPVLGVLLKGEERISSEVRGMVFGAGAGVLQLSDDAFEEAEHRLLATLQQLAHSTTATAGERLFAAEAGDAVRLLDVCRTRFDAVLMNPPFGEPVPATKPYLRTRTPGCPPKTPTSLPPSSAAALSCASPTATSAHLPCRDVPDHLHRLAHPGVPRHPRYGPRRPWLRRHGAGARRNHRLCHQPRSPQPSHTASFIRLLKDTDRPCALATVAANARAGREDPRVFRVPISEFAAVPGSPIAYWMGPSTRRLFIDFPPLEGNGAEVRQGLATGDDFRFVRAFWEVDPRRIARSKEETRQDKRWCPFAKGGEYSPLLGRHPPRRRLGR